MIKPVFAGHPRAVNYIENSATRHMGGNGGRKVKQRAQMDIPIMLSTDKEKTTKQTILFPALSGNTPG
jgi:hypothetical protein